MPQPGSARWIPFQPGALSPPIASARFHFPFKLDRPAGSGSAIARNATRYAASMIIGFRHKGRDTFYPYRFNSGYSGLSLKQDMPCWSSALRKEIIISHPSSCLTNNRRNSLRKNFIAHRQKWPLQIHNEHSLALASALFSRTHLSNSPTLPA